MKTHENTCKHHIAAKPNTIRLLLLTTVLRNECESGRWDWSEYRECIILKRVDEGPRLKPARRAAPSLPPREGPDACPRTCRGQP